MKLVNNKTRRLVNEVKKNLDLTLTLVSNKHWEIEKDSLNDSHFIVSPSTIKVVNGKLCECLRIQALNSIDEKFCFIPIFRVIRLTHKCKNWYLIKVNERDIPEFLEIAKRNDGIFTAKNWVALNGDIQINEDAFNLELTNNKLEINIDTLVACIILEYFYNEKNKIYQQDILDKGNKNIYIKRFYIPKELFVDKEKKVRFIEPKLKISPKNHEYFDIEVFKNNDEDLTNCYVLAMKTFMENYSFKIANHYINTKNK